MSDVSLNYLVAKRSMSLIASQSSLNHLDVIGISKDDFKLVTSGVPWQGSQRNRVTSALHTLMSGVLDAAGVPRFALPAEWVAACIAVFVSPVNIQLACRYIERPGSVSDLSRGIEEFDTCTASQLFALIVSFHGSDAHQEARRTFEHNTKLKLDSIIDDDMQKSGGKNG